MNNFWNSWDKNDNQSKTQPPINVNEGEQSEREKLPVEDDDRKEADITLNRFFQSIESDANRKVRFDIPENNEDDEWLGDYHWLGLQGDTKTQITLE